MCSARTTGALASAAQIRCRWCPVVRLRCFASSIGLLAILFAGCGIARVGFSIRNETDTPVTVFQEFQRAFPVEVAEVNSGNSVFVDDVITKSSECTTGILVARAPSGAEIARRDLPLCNQQTWVIAR